MAYDSDKAALIREVKSLRTQVLDMENDCACLPEDYSVTEYVEYLRGICKELAGVRDAADRMVATRNKLARPDWNIFRADTEMIEALDNLSPEAKEYGK